jgi:hypothetical protein
MPTMRNRRLAICKDCHDYRKVCRDCGRCDECSQHAACVWKAPDAADLDDLIGE